MTTKQIRCITCGSKVTNDLYFYCDSCKLRKDARKTCNHTPTTKHYETTCAYCGLKIIPIEWREK